MRVEKDQLIQLVEHGIPFNHLLGLRVEELKRGSATVRMPYCDAHIGDVLRPALHGGAVAALVDATAGAAAFTQTAPADRVSTVDMRIDYLRPSPKRDLLARATVLRMGSRISVVNVVVWPEGEEEGPVAEGRAVYSVRREM